MLTFFLPEFCFANEIFIWLCVASTQKFLRKNQDLRYIFCAETQCRCNLQNAFFFSTIVLDTLTEYCICFTPFGILQARICAVQVSIVKHKPVEIQTPNIIRQRFIPSAIALQMKGLPQRAIDLVNPILTHQGWI